MYRIQNLLFYIILVFIISLFIGTVKCISHCENVPIDKEYWNNEGAAIIYMMKSSQQNWQGQVSELIHLQRSLKNIGVTLQLTIATNKNCTAYHTVKEFRIDEGEIWNTLEHHNDYPEAYVIDRCGKVTYHLIFPWSLHKFPFVKGAVLSTFFDKPCGPCDLFHSYQVEPPKEFSEKDDVKIYPKMTSTNSVDESDEGAPPIDIIIKDKHKHEGDDEIFEYTEIELGNNHHHKHFHSLDDIEFITYQSNDMKTNENKNKQIKDYSVRLTHKTKRFITENDEESISSTEIQLNTLSKKLKEIAMICGEMDTTYMEGLYRSLNKAINSSGERLTKQDRIKKEEIARHYEKLKNWISYIV